MRSTKFRAWFSELKEMVYPDGNGYFIPSKGIGTYLMDGLGKPLNLDDLSEPDGIIFDQFTGLTDKNGVDIYEEDLLRSEPGVTYIAVLNEKYARFWLVPLEEHIRLPLGNTWCWTINSDLYEIIGNIHEQKHLLK